MAWNWANIDRQLLSSVCIKQLSKEENFQQNDMKSDVFLRNNLKKTRHVDDKSVKLEVGVTTNQYSDILYFFNNQYHPKSSHCTVEHRVLGSVPACNTCNIS